MSDATTPKALADITDRLRKDKWHITGVDAEEAAQTIEDLRDQLAQTKGAERHIYQSYSSCDDQRRTLSVELAAARAQCAGYLAQHHRDSAELRRLCQARDDETKARKQAQEALYAERDRAAAAVKAERRAHIATIAERDSLRAEVAASKAEPEDPQSTPIPCDLHAGGVTYPKGTPFCNVVDALCSQVDELRAELATERMRLSACGVIALANTPDSAAKARDMHPDYMSASAQDVMRAVDSEMALRAEVERLRTESVPLGAIRVLAVEAIRDVTGCPDVSGNGINLTDVMEATAKLATYAVLSAPPVAEVEGLAPKWLPIESAPDDMAECVVVRWLDSEGQEQRDLDYKEEGTWRHWHDRAEHTEMIGGYGASYTPPYQGWMPLPPPPVAEGV